MNKLVYYPLVGALACIALLTTTRPPSPTWLAAFVLGPLCAQVTLALAMSPWPQQGVRRPIIFLPSDWFDSVAMAHMLIFPGYLELVQGRQMSWVLIWGGQAFNVHAALCQLGLYT